MSNVLLSPNECEYIKTYFTNGVETFGKEYCPLVRNGKELIVRRDVKSNYQDINDSYFLSFILSKILPIGISSISIGSVKIIKYKTGDYFAPHTDFSIYDEGVLKSTLIIQLSDESDYTGGVLLVNGVPQSKMQGSYSLFDSDIVHEVTEMKSGFRYVLVVFLLDRDFNHTQTII
jgi:predicted 2-oxoglutarate/Fe(II)-dependent dioxygenase YbiX